MDSVPADSQTALRRTCLAVWVVFLFSILTLGLVFPGITQLPMAYAGPVLMPFALLFVGATFFIDRFAEKLIGQRPLSGDDAKLRERFRSVQITALILKLAALEASFILSLLALSELGFTVRIYLLVAFGGFLGMHFPTVRALDESLARITKGPPR